MSANTRASGGKFQAPNAKFQTSSKFHVPDSDTRRVEEAIGRLPKPQPMDERTEAFALRVRDFIRRLPKTLSNREDVPQLVRASGSVGANYIEANESLGPKDFLMHLRIARKEARSPDSGCDSCSRANSPIS